MARTARSARPLSRHTARAVRLAKRLARQRARRTERQRLRALRGDGEDHLTTLAPELAGVVLIRAELRRWRRQRVAGTPAIFRRAGRP